MIGIRVTPADLLALSHYADALGLTVSNAVRQSLGLPCTQTTGTTAEGPSENRHADKGPLVDATNTG